MKNLKMVFLSAVLSLGFASHAWAETPQEAADARIESARLLLTVPAQNIITIWVQNGSQTLSPGNFVILDIAMQNATSNLAAAAQIMDSNPDIQTPGRNNSFNDTLDILRVYSGTFLAIKSQVAKGKQMEMNE